VQFAGGEFFLQRLVNMLLALHAALAGKFVADSQPPQNVVRHHRGQVVAGHAGENEFFDLYRGASWFRLLISSPASAGFSVSTDTAAKQAKTTPRLISGATSETPKKP
jgi:hypothetical protein